jgi:hypothetical protein
MLQCSELSSPTNAIGLVDHLAISEALNPIQAREETMEAYRIDRFGSVDGIVLRSSEDPRPGPKEILMRARLTTAI